MRFDGRQAGADDVWVCPVSEAPVGRPRPTPAVCSNLYPGLFDSLREGLGKSGTPRETVALIHQKQAGRQPFWWLARQLCGVSSDLSQHSSA